VDSLSPSGKLYCKVNNLIGKSRKLGQAVGKRQSKNVTSSRCRFNASVLAEREYLELCLLAGLFLKVLRTVSLFLVDSMNRLLCEISDLR
jgi:hypothetical protein